MPLWLALIADQISFVQWSGLVFQAHLVEQLEIRFATDLLSRLKSLFYKLLQCRCYAAADRSASLVLICWLLHGNISGLHADLAICLARFKD